MNWFFGLLKDRLFRLMCSILVPTIALAISLALGEPIPERLVELFIIVIVTAFVLLSWLSHSVTEEEV